MTIFRYVFLQEIVRCPLVPGTQMIYKAIFQSNAISAYSSITAGTMFMKFGGMVEHAKGFNVI